MNKEKVLTELDALHELVSTQERMPCTAAGVLRAMEVIEQIPADDQWIPVTERLPEDIVNPITRDAYVYPVTVDLGGVTDIRYYSFCRGHWYNQGPRKVDSLVIAWLPLPEPYKEES